MIKSNNDLPKVEHKSTKSSYVKPSSIISSTKQLKQPLTFQIQLDKKERKPKIQDECSMRVSPIPDLEFAIIHHNEANTEELPQYPRILSSSKQVNSMSKNYQSAKDSEKIFNTKKRTEKNKQIIEIEIFDKAQNLIETPLSTRNQYNSSSILQKSRLTTSDKQKLGNKFRTRTSNMSQDS